MAEIQLTELLETAEALLEKGEFHHAKPLFEQALTLAPQDAEILHALGVIAAKEQDYLKAEHLVRAAIALEPALAPYHNHLGNILQAQHLWEAAIIAHETALALEPDHAESYNNLGNVYYRQQDLEQAAACYTLATQKRPDYLGAWYNLALIRQKQGNFPAAIESLQTILHYQETLPEVHFQLAKLYQQQEDYDRAIDHYQKTLDRRPDFLEALYNLGTIYLSLQQYNLAEHYFQQAAALEANSENLQYNLGIIANRKGQQQIAIAHYARALELAPAMAEAHQNLANLYSELKQIDLAVKHYQEVLRLQPDNKSVAYMLQAILQGETPATAPATYIENLFDDYAGYYNQHLTKKLNYLAPELLIDKLKILTTLPSRAWTVYDLGCGTGLCGALLKPYCRELTGIDLSGKMLEEARQQQVYDALIQDDICKALATQETATDLIIAADVFIYIGDLSEIFKESARLLKPQGLFAFTVEKSDGETYILQATARFAHSEHYIKQLAQIYGFSPLAMDTITLRKHNEDLITGLLIILQKN